ncbi:MAG: hypothetical protein AB7S38_31795 [Vulcanimicrobiota bacterium]
MRVLLCGPAVLTDPTVVERALEASGVEVQEVACLAAQGALAGRAAQWASSQGVPCLRYTSREEAIDDLSEQAEAAVVAILDPESSEGMETVDLAEKARIPVFVYRELFRRNARLNCRLQTISRPDVWIRAMDSRHRDFFNQLWELCKAHEVEILPSPDHCGDQLVRFADADFEGLQIDKNGCRIRSRGSMRNRKVRLDQGS